NSKGAVTDGDAVGSIERRTLRQACHVDGDAARFVLGQHPWLALTEGTKHFINRSCPRERSGSQHLGGRPLGKPWAPGRAGAGSRRRKATRYVAGRARERFPKTRRAEGRS